LPILNNENFFIEVCFNFLRVLSAFCQYMHVRYSFELGLTWSATNNWLDSSSIRHMSVDSYGWYFDLEVRAPRCFWGSTSDFWENNI